MPAVTRSQTKYQRDDIKYNFDKPKDLLYRETEKKPIQDEEYFDYCILIQLCKKNLFKRIRVEHLKQCSSFQVQTIQRILDYIISNKVYYDYPQHSISETQLNEALEFQKLLQNTFNN